MKTTFSNTIDRDALNRLLKQATVYGRSVKRVNQDTAFNFDANKRRLIENLDWLASLSVEELTFRKKFEEIKSVSPSISEYGPQAMTKIWRPTDIYNEEMTIKEITELQPRMVVVSDVESKKLWTAFRVYCSSAEYNQAPGRLINFLLMDDVSDKVLGFASVASDVISISDRDAFIGWTQADKIDHRMLKHSTIGTTIVPTQPFGSNFLGGKLAAAMVTSDVVRDAWENQKDGEATSCKLVGMTTTSLYGSFSMYNSLKWWKPVGSSKGLIPIKPYEGVYKDWHDWLKEHRTIEYHDAMTQKEGVSGPVTGAKTRVLNLIYEAVGIKTSQYCHGHERGVYYSCFYENTREFLCRKIAENELRMKPLFKGNVETILQWWKPRAIERYKRLKSEGRLNPKKLFYQSMREMDYETAKGLFFQDVGQ